MRVLHVIPSIAPRYGGPSRAIVEMCDSLMNEGVETLIATTDADGRDRLPVKIGIPFAYEGLPVIFFPRDWSESFKYSSLLPNWLRANVAGFDAVHVHAVFSHSSLAAARASQERDVPYIVRPLGSLDPWSLRQRRFAKAILWYAGVKRMLRQAAAIHYTTASERRLAEEALGINSGVVIPLALHHNTSNGRVVAKQNYALSASRSPYIVVISRIHQKKNIEGLIDAFSWVSSSQQHKRWKLVIAGDGEADYVERLRALARRTCGERVNLIGWIDGTRKIDLLRGASLFVLISYQENFGLSVLEAMSSGVPVFVSNRVNLSDEIAAARAGWVVDLERESLRQTLSEALSDDAERAARGAAGRKLACSRYTWPIVAKELVGLYRQIQTRGNNQLRIT